MTDSVQIVTEYQDSHHQVTWFGLRFIEGEEFDNFLHSDVFSRLIDEEGEAEFESVLNGLQTTGFGKESVKKILAAKYLEERKWAIGESLAEAFLTKTYSVTWPWNMDRDKRNVNASLPGADLVGFVKVQHQIQLVIGEVKTSSDEETPPNTMYGRSGMIYQLDNLVNDLNKIRTILSWLWWRCKNTEHEQSYKDAISLLFNSGNKSVSLFGILIRDTTPNCLDLKNRGKALSKKIDIPTSCCLFALYLPFNISEFHNKVLGGE